MNVLVQPVFFTEKGFVERAALLVVVVQFTDIATGTERLVATAAQHHGNHIIIGSPLFQAGLDLSYRFKIDRIVSGRAVDGEVSNPVADFGKNERLNISHSVTPYLCTA